jgi:hypothetical protein
MDLEMEKVASVIEKELGVYAFVEADAGFGSRCGWLLSGGTVVQTRRSFPCSTRLLGGLAR